MSDDQGSSWKPLAFEGFSGLNTEAARPAIKDDEMAWCDGFMPVGPSTLRTIPGHGPAVFTAIGGPTVVCFGFGQILAQPMMATVLSDGSVYRTMLGLDTGVQVGPPGTITSPSIQNVGFSQWGAELMIIVANQANGYWQLHTTGLYGAGTLAPGAAVTNGGSGYTHATASVSGGSGSGASFEVFVLNGSVSAIAVLSPGSGYLASDSTPTLTISGDGTGATGTVALMPFGINGTCAEVYQSRVWIANQANVIASAPETPTDFAISSGAVSFTSNDSFLRYAYTKLVQTNGFLYLVGDSSVNYISGVSTSGSPPETSFTNQNADPEVGSPFSASVTTLGSNIAMANPSGVYVSYGGRVTKISDALNGVWITVPNFGGMQLSAGKALVYGKKCFVILVPVIDSFSGLQVNKLFMWDEKRWWSTQQDISLTFIASLEQNSNFSTYGTDGISIYPLFQSSSSGFSKTVQSKLFSSPGGFINEKSSNRVWVLGSYGSTVSPNLTVNVDNESSTQPITLAPGTPSTNGSLYVSPPTATGQAGTLLGMTITTNAADFTLISAAIDSVLVGFRG